MRRSSSSPATASIADEAFAGDVVGIPEPRHAAHRRHADRGRGHRLRGVPNFAPEILRRVKLGDADEGQEAARGAAADGGRRRRAAVHSPVDGSPAIVGVVGALQLDVLKERLRHQEYTVCRSISRCRAFRSAAGSEGRSASPTVKDYQVRDVAA
jgi:peptide chain release factor 3